MIEELVKIIEKYRHSPEFSTTVWDDVNSRGMTGDTLLHAAVTRTDRADVSELIRLGADVNAVGDLGNTPLHDAASRGLVEIIQKLVAAGASATSRNEFGETPIDLARLMQSEKSLKKTLRALSGR